jgi:hypothetical protein
MEVDAHSLCTQENFMDEDGADLYTEMIEAEEERIKERDATKKARQHAQKAEDKEASAKKKNDA